MVARRSLLLAAPVLGAAAALGAPLLTDTALAAPTPRSIDINSSSPYSNIKALQHLLTAYGIPTNPDGIFGAKTTAGVKTYQSRNSIGATGYAGPQTMASMVGRANTAVKLNWTNPNTVKAVEQLLVKVGLTVPVDGKFVAADVTKVRSFQTSKGLPVTGTVDHLTWSYLFQPTLPTSIRKGPITQVAQYNAPLLASKDHDCGPASIVMLERRLGLTPQGWVSPTQAGNAISYVRRTVLGLTDPSVGLGWHDRVETLAAPMRSVLKLNARGATTDAAAQVVRNGGVAMICGWYSVSKTWQLGGNEWTVPLSIKHWITIQDYSASTGKYTICDPARKEFRPTPVTLAQLKNFARAASTATITSIAIS